MSQPLPSSSSSPSCPSSPRLAGTTPHVQTAAGRAYDATIQLRDSCKSTAVRRDGLLPPAGDAMTTRDATAGGVVGVVAGASGVLDGGAVASVGFCEGEADVETHSLESMERDILTSQCCPSPVGGFPDPDDLPVHPTALSASYFSFHRPFDLTRFPLSYSEAIAHSDASIWRAAMDREKQSLEDMGAFEEADFPPGSWTIGVKWVFDLVIVTGRQNPPGHG